MLAKKYGPILTIEIYFEKTLTLLDLSFFCRTSYKAYDMQLGPFWGIMMGAWHYFEFHLGFQIFQLNLCQRYFVQNVIYDVHNMCRYFGGKLRGLKARERT